jgi:hypothetical protein
MQDLNGAAGNGMAYSSQYARAVGQTSGAHQNTINDLNSANSLYAQQVAAQKASIQDNFNQELQAAAQQRARNAYTQAGSLGFGKYPKHPSAGGSNMKRKAAQNHNRKKGKR